MKYTFPFFLYFMLGVFLVFVYKNVTHTFSTQKLKSPPAKFPFSLDIAPSQSLKGAVTLLSGDVFWQSRTATEPAHISIPMQIQQGEEILIKEKGQAAVIFEHALNILIFPKTQVNFVQTLPENIVISQNSGTAQYSRLGESKVSVRSLSLLITIQSGDVAISVNENQPALIVNVKKGLITAGYNDNQQITQTVNVSEGKRLIFNTDTKEGKVEQL